MDHTVASAPPQHILPGTSQSFLSQFLPKSHLHQYSALWEGRNRYVRMSRAPRKREGQHDHHIVFTQQKHKRAEHRRSVWGQEWSGGRKHLKKPSKASFTLIKPFPGTMLPTVTPSILTATEKSQPCGKWDGEKERKWPGQQYKSLWELGCPDWPVLKKPRAVSL